MNAAKKLINPERLTVLQLCRQAVVAAVLACLGIAATVSALRLVLDWLWDTPDSVAGVASGFALTALLAFGLGFPLCLVWQSRELRDRSFTYVGFLATFFGLGVLVVFFVQLGMETITWFETAPGLVARQNERYRAELRAAQTALRTKETEFDEAVLPLLESEKDQLAFYRAHIEGKWVALLEQATRKRKEEPAGKEKSAETLAEKSARRTAMIALVLKHLQETHKDYPPALREILELGLDTMMVEAQNVVERRREAELGIRADTSPWALAAAFVTNVPSNAAQDAGIWPALLGSVWLALITILVAVPIGVGAALYLEEYRHTGWLSRIIQVNINNLAGVPSVVFGILGGFVFVEMIFKPIHLHQAQVLYAYSLDAAAAFSLWDRLLLWLPPVASRNVLGGGLTLGLLTLPVVIIATQEAVRAVPDSIRHGSYALGATHWQTIWHHVLPMARPGILTGTILAISRAIGEAAPLVLFGALLLVQQSPTLFSGFTVMPMQIFNWADRPPVLEADAAGNMVAIDMWRYNAAFASVLLLIVLLTLNALAIYLRNRAQKRLRY